MTKVTSALISLLAVYARFTPVAPFYIPSFLNHTNGTNTTYHQPRPPIPSFTTVLGRPETPCTGAGVGVGVGQPLPSTTPASLGTDIETETQGPTAISALTSDCTALADDDAKERYLWYASGFTDNTTLLAIRNHGTCSIGIRPPHADVMANIISGWYVGGMDVAQIIRTAVRDYDVDGLMGATGMMHCEISSAANVDVQWAIFGPDEQAQAGWWVAPPVPSSAGKRQPVGMAVLSAVAVFCQLIFWRVVS
ncbi:Putative Ecp2 effector protein [Colletotrichum destructivum]|uniref:Ecp2 effector protein n=1 Tax=Colletotrichum destructivum TaxID=34406 RepID=A0AAX4I5Z6_9PEZI|nr:Putative Ecp2 effector protein [Colletotrichum destructivum]